MSEADFTTASEEIKTWKPANGSPGNDEKLCLYANFKQATVGACRTRLEPPPPFSPCLNQPPPPHPLSFYCA